MGTFASYIGNISIPEEKKTEYSENMIKLLQHGGMVNFDNISLYGKEITLIRPVELDEEGDCEFHYSYFEDDPWESAVFNSNTGVFGAWKIGTAEYNFVICAGLFLAELYSKDHGYVEMGGDMLNAPDYVMWINHVLDTDFSLEKRFDLWKYYEAYVLSIREWDHDLEDIDFDPFECIPIGYEEYMGGTELVDILYIINGTDEVSEEDVSGAYVKDVSILKKELDKFYKANPDDGKDIIWQLISMPLNERKSINGTGYDKLAEISTRMAARVFVYLTAEILNLSFWKEWLNIYEKVYDDEVMPQYASNEVLEKRRLHRSASLGKMKTSEFLKNDGIFTFHNTPKEIKHKKNYIISDDDLMYWWDGSDKIQLSDGMIKQISKWVQDYGEISKTLSTEEISDYDMLKNLMSVLDLADKYYRRIFSFNTMFYDFVGNSKDVKYIAAVKLLEKIIEDNKEQGSIIEHAQGSWTYVSKNVTFNEGRVTIKRFLSLMANKQLRKVYFGF